MELSFFTSSLLPFTLAKLTQIIPEETMAFLHPYIKRMTRTTLHLGAGKYVRMRTMIVNKSKY